MIHKLRTYILMLSLVCLIFPGSANALKADVDVMFSPDKTSAQLNRLIAQIDGAKQEVLIAAYSLSLPSIVDSLVRAKGRGVSVKLWADDQQRNLPYSRKLLTTLESAGIPVTTDTTSQLMHNKFIVVDRLEVVTGSFNFTKSATVSNYENLLFINSDQIAGQYREYFFKRSGHKDAPQ